MSVPSVCAHYSFLDRYMYIVGRRQVQLATTYSIAIGRCMGTAPLGYLTQMCSTMIVPHVARCDVGGGR